MRFRLLFLAAAAIAAGSAGSALAQDEGGGTVLRGSLDGDVSPLVLATIPLPLEAPPAAASAADDGDAGRVVRQQPQARGPDPETLDETVTGSVPRRTTAPDEDPFAAIGIRAGSFILYPSLTTTVKHDSNASGGGPATTLTAVPELRLQSDWARHEARLTLRGSYETYLDGSAADSPAGAAEASGRIDLKEGWSIDLDGRYGYQQQATSDPNFPAGVDNRPGVHDLSGSTALNGRLGRGLFTVEGSVARTDYENGASGGAVVDQGYRDNTVYGARLRLGYETPADVTPFVEGEVARRAYDRLTDNNGLMRSSLTATGRAGIAFDRGPVLSGEIAAGYGGQWLDDPALASLHALTVDGSLAWSPVRLFTVTVDAATAFDPSTDPASSGSVVHSASVDVAYAWKHDLTVNWTAGVSHQAFQGTGRTDTTVKAGVGATWKLSRRLSLSGGYVHEWTDSTAAGQSYQSDAVRLELRLQR